MLRVTGEVVRYEQRPWTMDGRSGVSRVARVLVGRADFADVHFPESAAPPRDGDLADWAVIPSVSSGKVRCTFVGEWAKVVPPAPRSLVPNGKPAA